MVVTIRTQQDYEAVLDVLTTLPSRMVYGNSVSENTLRKCGLALLGLIRKAFIIKSMGGTDEAGDRWASLQLSTIIQRARKRGVKVTSHRRKKKRVEREQSSNPHRRRASNIIRGSATRIYDKYSMKDTRILRETDKLLESLSPNSGSTDQVFEVSDNKLTIGTRREGAAAHHKGTDKLPQRRLWPPVNSWPDSWWNTITKHIQDGTIEQVKDLIRKSV